MKLKSKILVTGGNGQLGRELQEFSSLHTGLEFVFLSREELPIEQFELVLFLDCVCVLLMNSLFETFCLCFITVRLF